MTAQTSKQSEGPDEEEVLLAFAVEQVQSRETLARYVREYPQYAQALIDCSIEIMLQATRDEGILTASQAAVDDAWDHFEAAMDGFAPVQVAPVNPFAKLNPAALRVLGVQLGINSLLLARLRDRAIDAATIPKRFVQRLAASLGVPHDDVAIYLGGRPTMASGQSYRSSEKPAVIEQISFEQAITTSQLTQQQQDALRALQE